MNNIPTQIVVDRRKDGKPRLQSQKAAGQNALKELNRSAGVVSMGVQGRIDCEFGRKWFSD